MILHTGVGNANVQTVTYAHGVAVAYVRATSGWDGARGWHYTLTTEDGAEVEETGFAPTKRECVEAARIARDALQYRFTSGRGQY